jgi:hypothetical protein
MMLCSHEFFGRADNGRPVAQLLTHYRYSPRDLCVCQVLAIPGQQIVNGVNRGHSNMCGIRKSVRRKDARSHDGLRQRLGVFGDLEGRQTADDRESLFYFCGIAD